VALEGCGPDWPVALPGSPWRVETRAQTHPRLAFQCNGAWFALVWLRKGLGIFIDRRLELGGGRIRQVAGLPDVVENVGVLGADKRQ
jgi:hypothetical protein